MVKYNPENKMFLIERKAIDSATRKLQKLLGNNLITVAVFGSRVRGDFTEESDFDVLVVVKNRTFDIIMKVNDIFGKEENKTGVTFSAVIKQMETFEKEKRFNTPFYQNIKKEGVVFYGRA
jgi:predicted nucleotidyltransferase